MKLHRTIKQFLLVITMISTALPGKDIRNMNTPHQNAKRIIRTYTAHYQATPEQVFPQLCPVLEYDWLEHWNTEIVYSESGVAELDCIFKTFFEPGETEVWTVTQYKKNQCIEFIIMNTNTVKRYTITLRDNHDGTCDGTWTQVVTALNPKGEKYLDLITEKAYSDRIRDISLRLNYCLETGTMYREGEYR